MPLLFSLAIHDALENVQTQLRTGEQIFAFLDDVSAVTAPERSRSVYNIKAHQLWTVAGIRLISGTTRVWNRAGECPPKMSDLGDEVWNSDGIKVLGTPVGPQHFVQQMVDKRFNEERKLWDALTWVPDLQSAWQIRQIRLLAQTSFGPPFLPLLAQRLLAQTTFWPDFGP